MPDARLINWINKILQQGRSKKEIVDTLSSKGYSRAQINEAFKSIQSAKQSAPSGEFGFLDKLKYLFSNPNLFFEKIKAEKGIKNALLMYVNVVAFTIVVSFFIFRFISRSFYIRMPFEESLQWGFGIIPFSYFGLLGLMFKGLFFFAFYYSNTMGLYLFTINSRNCNCI